MNVPRPARSLPAAGFSRNRSAVPAVCTVMAAGSRRNTTSRLRRAVVRYRDARRSLHTPASWQSRYGLDWTNFFLADIQTGFGTFVAFYLANLGWSKGGIGLALTVGTLAAVVSQIPAGALADAVSWKRGLVALGILMVSAAAVILALFPEIAGVFLAELLNGTTGGIVTPTIGAISLGLVGRRAMSVRTGRNFRYAAAGHALTAAIMGVVGSYLSDSAIFIASACIGAPALVSLAFIRPQEIDYVRARNARRGEHGHEVEGVLDLAKNRSLIAFTVALMLFQFADASMSPLIGESLGMSKLGLAPLRLSALLVLPQIIVAVFAPWIGYHSEQRGRKPLLLIAFAIEPVRAALLAFASSYSLLLVVQFLDGINGAIITVLTVLVITDLTAGTGRFNLAQGAVGSAIGIAASLSTLATGFLVQGFGPTSGFIAISAVAVAATALLWILVPETKPADYGD
jgi:MFS family permease